MLPFKRRLQLQGFQSRDPPSRPTSDAADGRPFKRQHLASNPDPPTLSSNVSDIAGTATCTLMRTKTAAVNTEEEKNCNGNTEEEKKNCNGNTEVNAPRTSARLENQEKKSYKSFFETDEEDKLAEEFDKDKRRAQGKLKAAKKKHASGLDQARQDGVYDKVKEELDKLDRLYAELQNVQQQLQVLLHQAQQDAAYDKIKKQLNELDFLKAGVREMKLLVHNQHQRAFANCTFHSLDAFAFWRLQTSSFDSKKMYDDALSASLPQTKQLVQAYNEVDEAKKRYDDALSASLPQTKRIVDACKEIDEAKTSLFDTRVSKRLQGRDHLVFSRGN